MLALTEGSYFTTLEPSKLIIYGTRRRGKLVSVEDLCRRSISGYKHPGGVCVGQKGLYTLSQHSYKDQIKALPHPRV